MKKKWVSSLLLGSLFLQVVTPMVSFAQETIETTTATSATIKKEDKPTKNSTDTSTSKDTEEQSATQPEASNPMDTNHPLNISPVPSGTPSDTEKKNLDNQEATKPSVQAVAPVADENLGSEKFINSNFDDGPFGLVTSIPGWTTLDGSAFHHDEFIGTTPWTTNGVWFGGGKLLYQDVDVTPGSTVVYSSLFQGANKVGPAAMYAGPVSNNLEDFSVVVPRPPSLNARLEWSTARFVVPQGMTKMRFIIGGELIYIDQMSLKEDLNPPINTAPPEIHATDKRIPLNSTFDPLEGVTAEDVEDGPITLYPANVIHNDVDTSKEGTYSVTYSVVDSGGWESRKTITVTVGDANTPPVIHVPNTTVSIPQGGSFDPAPSKWNITATDAEDGDLTKNIVVKSNNVDTSKPGQYKVTYSVADSGSLSATADMNVVVTSKPTDGLHLSVYNGGNAFIVPQGEDVQVKGQVWDTVNGAYVVTIRKAGTSPGSAGVVGFQGFANIPLGEKQEYSITIPTNELTPGQFYSYIVRAEEGISNPVEQTIQVFVTKGQVGEKPVIQAEDKTIVQNSNFDPLADVSATDKEDGTVPVTVYENTVDTSKPGTYKVVYRATDSDKNTTEKTIAVTVEPSELSFNVPDTLNYDEKALSGNKEYAKRTDKNWQITIDNSKKVKWQVKAKAGEMVGETSHAKYKDATVYVDDLGNESSLASTVLIAQGDEQKVDPIINWQEDKGVLFAVDPTSMKAENYKGTINWMLEQAP
ncbi:immunoglobulin-like domain-containing protein [Enterococcus mundtii]|uniref:immunoglobulin-like domain-containing protein n=1 Tax=Enterococcus mundtii TaxID=53346 RepID=UPI0008242B9B|nr:immunoglobulin-like domain-containing protein [Enterococcus mundtii]